MKRLSILFVCAIVAMFVATDGTFAQAVIPPGGSQFNPPLPAAPPPPKISVPAIPQMDAPARQNYVAPPGPSFGDRVTTCLDEGAAGGLGPAEREEYSRSCANR